MFKQRKSIPKLKLDTKAIQESLLFNEGLFSNIYFMTQRKHALSTHMNKPWSAHALNHLLK